MSKIWGYYADKLDRTWYNSSNIKFSECEDNKDELKTLKVVFNNGTQYQYNEVDVNDYLLFREDLSQGKALNKFIKAKGYEYEKIEDANIESIDAEFDFRMNDGIFVDYTDGKLILQDSVDKVIFEKEVDLNIDTFNTACGVLSAVGKNLYVINGVKPNEEDENKELVEEAPF